MPEDPPILAWGSRRKTRPLAHRMGNLLEPDPTPPEALSFLSQEDPIPWQPRRNLPDENEESLGNFKMPEPLLEGGEEQKLYDALKKMFLSPESTTEKLENPEEEIKIFTEEELQNILENNIENLHTTFDRTGQCPVSKYILSSYNCGLPLFRGNPSVNEHTIKAIRFIFHKLEKETPQKKKQILKRLVDAYSACQMEQGRVIDAIYGTLSGRDKTFKEQILSLLDVQKDNTLTHIVNRLNPHAWETGDEDPSAQIPHIYSSYVIAIGDRIGLRGVKAAVLDSNALPIDDYHADLLYQLFLNVFSMKEFIQSIITDVNQQADDADRFLDRTSLGKWAGTEKENGFDSFSIYWDEERKEQYESAPDPKNIFQPFLNRDSTLKILKHLFVPDFEAKQISPQNTNETAAQPLTEEPIPNTTEEVARPSTEEFTPNKDEEPQLSTNNGSKEEPSNQQTETDEKAFSTDDISKEEQPTQQQSDEKALTTEDN